MNITFVVRKKWMLEAPAARVRHSITSRVLDVAVCKGEWHPTEADIVAEGDGVAWVESSRLDSLPTTSLVQKALTALDRQSG